jgi:hypothetical protein
VLASFVFGKAACASGVLAHPSSGADVSCGSDLIADASDVLDGPGNASGELAQLLR